MGTGAAGSRRIRLIGFLAAVAITALSLNPVVAQKKDPGLNTNFDKWFLQRFTPPPGQGANASDLSASGVVVGSVGQHAFRFSTITSPGLDLGTLGGSYSLALAISGNGKAVGMSTKSNESERAFLYSGGSMIDLGTLPGDDGSWAYGINNLGHVVGMSYYGDYEARGFLWKPGTGMVDIGSLGLGDTTAADINDWGEIAGDSRSPSGILHVFRYFGGTMTDLGTLGGLSTARRINDAGQVVGWSWLINGPYHACLWNPGMAPIDLDGRPDEVSSASDINDDGVVVGGASFGTQSHAVRWTYNPNTGHYLMLDLNSLLPAGSDFVLTHALGINDTGQIAGVGKRSGGNQEAFLLTPVRVRSLEFSANPVVGGSGVLGVFELTNAPPVDISVTLSSANSAVTVPASALVDAGHGAGGFVASTVPVSSSTSGAIKASLGFLNSVSTTLTVRPPGVKSLVLSPSSVHAGSNTVATITLEKPAGPGGVVVAMTSSNPSSVWPAQSSKTIGEGSTSAVMTIHTAGIYLIPNNPPDEEGTLHATIKATANGIVRAATLQVVF